MILYEWFEHVKTSTDKFDTENENIEEAMEEAKKAHEIGRDGFASTKWHPRSRTPDAADVAMGL